MVDRVDWNFATPSGSGTVQSGAVMPAEPRSLDSIRPGEIVSGAELSQIVQQEGGNAPEPDGVPAALAQEMHRTADGYDANLDLLRESTSRVLSEVNDPQAFAVSFDTLSPNIRAKALRELWRHPGIALLDLIDRVEPKLTLSEAHEADRWLRKWAGALR